MSRNRFGLRLLPSRPSLSIVVTCGLCVASFLAAAWVSTTVTDRIPHFEDEYAFLFQAQTLAAGRLTAPEPPV